MRDVTVDLGAGGWKAFPVAFALFAPPALVYWLVWGEGFGTLLKPLSIALLFAQVVVHEAIHGITFALAGRVSLSKIRYGVIWRMLAPYAHLTVPIEVRAYRLAAAMPGIVLGVMPFVLGLAIGNVHLGAWGALGLATAGGDALILLRLRGVVDGSRILDHADRPGCLVFDPGESPVEVLPAAAAS